VAPTEIHPLSGSFRHPVAVRRRSFVWQRRSTGAPTLTPAGDVWFNTAVNSGILLYARAESRRRWIASVLLAALISVGGGASLFAAAAAHRTDTAFDRLTRQLNYPSISVLGAGDDGFVGVDPEQFDAIERIDGVRGFWVLAFVWVAAEEYPNFFSVAIVDRRGEAPDYLTVDGDRSATLGADDILVNEAMRDELGKGVGDTVRLLSLTDEQFYASMAGEDIGDLQGPALDVRIVGVIRAPEEISDAPDPFLVMSPAFYEQYADTVGGCLCSIEVNVAPDKLTAVEAELADLFPEASMERTEDLAARLTDTIALQRGAWWAMALAAAMASMIAIYYALREMTDGLEVDAATQNALGMTRGDRRAARLVILVPSVIVGSVGAAVVAYVLSPLAPVGVTRRAEPTPGLRWDNAVIVPGAFAVLAVSALVAGITVSGTATRTRQTRSPLALGSPTRSLGERMAFGPGRGAIGGVLIATMGIVAAMTVQTSIDHVLATPALYGADFDAAVTMSTGDDKRAVADELAADPDIEAVGVVLTDLESGSQTPISVSGPGGSIGLNPIAIASSKGTVDVLPTEGRAPGRADEVTVGQAVLDALDVDIGDRVSATGDGGTSTLTIVGIMLEPAADTTDRGFAMRPDGLEQLVGPTAPRAVVARFAPGSDHAAIVARHDDVFLRPTVVPSEIGNVGQLGGLPGWVGVLLATIGVLAMLNAAVQTVRRSRRQLAIHRALGFTAPQILRSHLWQAVIGAGIGVTVGVGGGVLAGRSIIRSLMTSVGAVPEIRLPVEIWAVAALAVTVCLCSGLVIGIVALRSRPGSVLRVE
jgi:hypothetical protein